ncbi:transposase [candidate division KSB1 bacterium]
MRFLCVVAGQHKISKKRSVLSDDRIQLSGFYTQQEYPNVLRLITYYDKETDKELVFLTNNFTLAAQTIADLYKARWQIELFFKWIKQNLKIKTFLGTSYNAVMTQIWVAMIYYLLLSFIKFQTKYTYSMQELARIIKELLMENVSLLETLSLKYEHCKSIKNFNSQLAFF